MIVREQSYIITTAKQLASIRQTLRASQEPSPAILGLHQVTMRTSETPGCPGKARDCQFACPWQRISVSQPALSRRCLNCDQAIKDIQTEQTISIQQFKEMIKRKTPPISLVLLLSLAVGGSLARFLQTTNSTTGPVIAPKRASVAYNSSLQCGECVVGGYISCVNGPANYTGTARLRTVCCKNAAVCPQAKNASWTCSNSPLYNQSSIIHKLQVCPFNASQCGPQKINLGFANDASCLQLNTLAKGTSCLYQVESKCGVPQLSFNDPFNIYTASLLVSNVSLPATQVNAPSCFANSQQRCQCRSVFNTAANSSNQVCDCQTVLNQTFARGACNNCTSYNDSQGNVLQVCSCSVQVPAQYTADDYCTCTKASKPGFLNCGAGCGIATSSNPVTLPQNQCKCVNMTSNNVTQLSCVCEDVKQCPEPSSIPVPQLVLNNLTCGYAYPCMCAATKNGSLACQCTNPQSNRNAFAYIASSECACSNVITGNKTWAERCKCCLQDSFVSSNLLAPVTCDSGFIKESCVCNNQTLSNTTTATSLTCNCAFPTGNQVVASNLKYPSQGQCDCEDINIGTKNCKCCVSPAVQVQQQQPICRADQTLQGCQCSGSLTSQQCSCMNARTGFLSVNMTTVAPSSCFCQGNSSKTCTCCVSESQFQSSRMQCNSQSESPATCSCNNVNGSLVCNCINKYFFNTPSALTFSNNKCACYPQANQTANINCQCCASASTFVAPLTCKNSVQVSAQSARVNLTLQTVSGLFSGPSVFANSGENGLNFTRSLVLNTGNCSCIQNGNTTASCKCCASQALWTLAQPTCQSSQVREECNCGNRSYNVSMSRIAYINQTTYSNVTCMKTGSSGELCASVQLVSPAIWNNTYYCYWSPQVECTYQPSTGKCGFTRSPALRDCLANPPKYTNSSKYQNQPVTYFNKTLVATNKTVAVNQTYNVPKYQWACNCHSHVFPSAVHMDPAPVSQSTCGCLSANTTNQTCNCCISKQYVQNLYLGKQNCSAGGQLADCTCNGARNSSRCACSPRNSSLTYKGITVDTTKCTCFNTTNSTTQTCACCVGNMTSYIPAAPVCNASLASSQQCQCTDFVNRQNSTQLQCQCRNTTTTVSQVAYNVTTYVNQTVIVQTNVTTNVTANSTGNSTSNSSSRNATSNQSTVVNTTKVVQIAVNTTMYRNVSSTSVTVTSQFLTRQQCSCLNYGNGTQMNLYSCNCCVPNTFSCPVSLTLESCSFCANYIMNAASKAQGWNCSCTRPDNGIVGQLQFSQSHCQGNAATGNYQCCATQTQLNTQWPVLTCEKNTTQQKQNCQCSPISKSGLLKCTCVNNNGRPNHVPTVFPSSQCLSKADGSGHQCCVPKIVQDTQIPYANCSAIGANMTSSNCQCYNQTVNVTVAGVNGTNSTQRQTQYNCQCTNDFFGTSKNMNFSQNACVYYNSSVSNCCLNQAQNNSLIPQLLCPSSGFLAQTGCSCTKSYPVQTCNCGFTYQGSNYTAKGLNTTFNNCMCNTTTCGCCISNNAVMQITEKQCSNLKAVCDKCVRFYNNATNRTEYNCSACTVQGPSYNVLNVTQNNLNPTACLCRSPGANCTCCVGQMPALPTQPKCSGATNQLLPNCACSSVNGTNVCDCSKTTGNVVSNYNGIQATNCSCASVARPSGLNTLQCSCCATPAQLATPPAQCSDSFTANQCVCTNSFSCNCAYQNTGVTVRNIPFNSTTCSCPNNNADTKNCSCCVSTQQYIDQVTPSCSPQNTLATCGCQNFTTVSGKKTTTQTRCNCVGNLATSWGSVSNNGIVMSTNGCGMYNITGTPVYKCCMPDRQLTQVRAPSCSASTSLNATCSCPISLNGGSANCSCAARSTNLTTYIPIVPLAASNCGCYNLTQNKQTTLQCSCCVNKTYGNQTLMIKNPVCPAGQSTAQSCICSNVFDQKTLTYQKLCNCTAKSGNVAQTRINMPFSSLSQCSCLNQTVNGKGNAATCACCVPNPPLTRCQQLALPTSQNLNCRCGYTLVNGHSQFACNCSAQVNSTKVLYVDQLLLQEQSCCCIEKSDILTGMGYKSCNCTQPAFTQTQNCKCTPAAGNPSSQMNCQCSDCNNVLTTQTFQQNTCKCNTPFAPQQIPSGKASNSTSNTTSSNSTKTNNTSGNATTSTNTTTNGTRVNTTSGNTTTAANQTANATTNGTKTNGTTGGNTTAANSTGNATSNGTKSNSTSGNSTAANATNSSGSTNSSGTSNSTKTNGTSSNGTASNTTHQNSSSAVNGSSPSNGTTQDNSISCSCPVQFAGLCPPVDFRQPVTQASCAAANTPQPPTVISVESQVSCKYQYKYLVAVVATNKDSSVLMQLQDYQMMFANSITMSIASLVLLTASMFLFY